MFREFTVVCSRVPVFLPQSGRDETPSVIVVQLQHNASSSRAESIHEDFLMKKKDAALLHYKITKITIRNTPGHVHDQVNTSHITVWAAVK